MKDSLFEMLLTLFEKTLAQLKESRAPEGKDPLIEKCQQENAATPVLINKEEFSVEVIKSASSTAMRVFTLDEQIKLTKASYQFIMRLFNLEVLSPVDLEKILNQLIFSDSRYVGLQETKWIIRNILSQSLSAEQLAFLDLVLYQKEDELPLH